MQPLHVVIFNPQCNHGAGGLACAASSAKAVAKDVSFENVIGD